MFWRKIQFPLIILYYGCRQFIAETLTQFGGVSVYGSTIPFMQIPLATKYIVMCQVHPVLAKTGQMYGPFFLNFFVGSYLILR